MIGAIAEQAGLCWGFEQDAQRFDATRNKISKEHHRLVLRALSEAGGHSLLGAAHSLGNLGLRIALLDPQAGLGTQTRRGGTGGGRAATAGPGGRSGPTTAARGTRSGLTSKRGATMGRKRPSRGGPPWAVHAFPSPSCHARGQAP